MRLVSMQKRDAAAGREDLFCFALFEHVQLQLMLAESDVEVAQVGLHAIQTRFQPVHSRFNPVEPSIDVPFEFLRTSIHARFNLVELTVIEKYPSRNRDQRHADD